MSRFKLELFKKKPADKLVLGATHIAAMTGNANYPQATRVPTDAQVQTAQDELATAQADVDNAEIAWRQKIQVRDQKVDTWDTVITARANNCEAVTPNDLVALASRSGEVALRAVVSERMQPGVVYTTFHHARTGANVITTDYSDWATNCPEYKVTAVQVRRTNALSRWQETHEQEAGELRRIAPAAE